MTIFPLLFFLVVVLADCKQAAPEYKHKTCIYTRIIGIRSLEGKLYAFPRYVRRREHAAEEDLQPRKLYYSGRLGRSRPAVENKDCRNKGFFLFIFFSSLLLFASCTSGTILLFTHASCAYIRVFFVIHQGRSEKKHKKKKRTNERANERTSGINVWTDGTVWRWR